MCDSGFSIHASTSGTMSSAPHVSPRNHVRQTVAKSCTLVTSPASSDRPPIVAESAVPAMMQSTRIASESRFASGERRMYRARSIAGTSASSMFPVV
jgi:hypothetical protein